MEKYKVELVIAGEGYTTGTMMMTEEQYRFVKMIADPDNWDNVEKEPWSGVFFVQCRELDEREALSKPRVSGRRKPEKPVEYKSGFANNDMAAALKKALA